jgi:hypothetical protein
MSPLSTRIVGAVGRATEEAGRSVSWYLVFIGTNTIPLRATSSKKARERVVAQYAERGVAVQRDEVRARKATADDAGWLRDMGADDIADALLEMAK